MKADEAEHARQEVERMLREAAAALGLTGPPLDRIMAIADDARLLAIAPANRCRELLRGIVDGQLFYWDSHGRSHEIAKMPTRYLHNAAEAMRARRLTGVEPFTMIAMDAEIARRESPAQEEKTDG